MKDETGKTEIVEVVEKVPKRTDVSKYRHTKFSKESAAFFGRLGNKGFIERTRQAVKHDAKVEEKVQKSFLERFPDVGLA